MVKRAFVNFLGIDQKDKQAKKRVISPFGRKCPALIALSLFKTVLNLNMKIFSKSMTGPWFHFGYKNEQIGDEIG
jgi:hypothetical protein